MSGWGILVVWQGLLANLTARVSMKMHRRLGRVRLPVASTRCRGSPAIRLGACRTKVVGSTAEYTNAVGMPLGVLSSMIR